MKNTASLALAPKATLLSQLAPGFAVSALVAVAAQFISEHYGAPAMLMALLLGIALNFLSDAGTRTEAGVSVTAKTVLRLGVALLGARVSVELIGDLGLDMFLLIVGGVVATIAFALLLGLVTRTDWRFTLLTGGAVAICGASAAMAIAAVLPTRDNEERDLIFTVLGVTVLSTIAMVIYPILSSWLLFDDRQAGVFIGGTIHDVAQVVGAGFSISNETGETATLVKLIRVAMLAPVVLVASLAIRYFTSFRARAAGGTTPPALPSFVVGFLALAVLNSLGLVPAIASDAAAAVSKWCLLVAIAAVGIKTSLGKVLAVGKGAILLIICETVFIASFILLGMYLLEAA